MMIKSINNKLNRFLSLRNLQLRRYKLENLRQDDIDCMEALYKTNASKVLLSIPLNKCRTQLWHSLEEENNPFVQTLKHYKRNGDVSYRGSELKKYYDSYQPKTAAEVLKLPSDKFQKIPALGFVLPWDIRDKAQALKTRAKVVLKENKMVGKNIDISAGYTEFGPVKEEKGRIEITRLKNIYKTIKANGYKESPYLDDGGIKGYFLRNDKDWCFIIKSGKHRAYTLAALGHHKIPVIVNMNFNTIVRESDARFWPQIKSGLFTVKETQILINNIINLNI